MTVPPDAGDASLRQLRRLLGCWTGVGSAILIGLILLTRGRQAMALENLSQLPQSIAWLVGGLIGPLLLLAFAPGVITGRAGAIAAVLVIAGVSAAQWLLAVGEALIASDSPRAGMLLKRLLAAGIALAIVIPVAWLWRQECSRQPEAHRITAARSARFRARVAIFLCCLLGATVAAMLFVPGVIYFASNPHGFGRGVGIIFVCVATAVAGGALWLLWLLQRLRRGGPQVGRSSAWQIALMLAAWLLLSGSAGVAWPEPLVRGILMIPTAVLCWALIELLHGSLDSNRGQTPAAFEVLQRAGPPPEAWVGSQAPRSMVEPMEGREHI
ncbi:MAG: hypothetical protein NZ561_09385 [Phycisphaerae bacterium]|nr:hypothetical protein [Phycisphaerae bacterium]